MMAVGFVYFVFLPAVLTTPLAGRAVSRFGTRPAFWGALAVAAAGLPLLVVPSVPAVLAGLAMVGAGTFFAQATATGFVGRAGTADRGSANGIYLASYFGGGLAGTALLGIVFERFGWPACVAGIGGAILLAAGLGVHLKVSQFPRLQPA
jgi:MFS family permease